MKVSLRRIALFIVLAMLAGASQAVEIRAIRILSSDENRFARDTARRLVDLLKSAEPATDVEVAASLDTNEAGSGKQLLVVIGDSAVSKVEQKTVPASPLLLIASQRSIREYAEKKSSIISMLQYEQPLPRLLNLAVLIDANKWHGGGSVIGIIATPSLQAYLGALETEATERRQHLRVEVVEDEYAVGTAVRRLLADEASVLLAVPDPLVHTPNTVQPILLLTYRAGVPVIGYSAAYLNAGAAVALYSTPDQLARQAAEIIAAWRSGKPVAGKQVPRYFTVGINPTVARSLGMDIPSAAVLEESLRTMSE